MLEHQNVRQYGQKADFLVPVCLFLCTLFCIFLIFSNPGNSIVFPIARIISRSPAKPTKSVKALPTMHAQSAVAPKIEYFLHSQQSHPFW